jgi:hypothetical protein
LVRFSGLFGLPLPIGPAAEAASAAATPVSNLLFLWLLLRAFAAGCTALTGIEAISNGVQAFKPPESKNAAQTMVAMGVIAMTLFIGITFLATRLHLIPMESESILSQMTRAITAGLPGGTFLYYWVQFFTMMILILAANTGYQDFPRLSSFLAKDGFLPRWMTNRGDRLVFDSGIIILAIISSIVVIVFNADEITMLPLYALGVMLSFTLSQSGMFRLMGRISHLKPGETYKTHVTTIHYEKWVFWKRLLNGLGAMVTGVVLIILIATKFVEGAWIVVLAIPLLVSLFQRINHHYGVVAHTLSTQNKSLGGDAEIADIVIVPIASVHNGSVRALNYANRLATDVRAIYISTGDEQARKKVEAQWAAFHDTTAGIELVCIEYDYRDILTPLEDYIVKVHQEECPGKILTVVIPEFVPDHRVAEILHNQSANLLRHRLRHHENIILIDVPFQIHG